jgi:hypothetical protein
MAYDQTVPANGHSGSQDYTPMRNNFVQIQTSFSVDHEPLGSGVLDGFHKQVTIPAATAPGAQTNPQGVFHTVQATGGLFTAYVLPFFKNQAGDLAMLPDVIGSATNAGFKFGQLIFNFGTFTILAGNLAFAVNAAINYPTGVLISIACCNSPNSIAIRCTSTVGPPSVITATLASVAPPGGEGISYLSVGY